MEEHQQQEECNSTFQEEDTESQANNQIDDEFYIHQNKKGEVTFGLKHTSSYTYSKSDVPLNEAWDEVNFTDSTANETQELSSEFHDKKTSDETSESVTFASENELFEASNKISLQSSSDVSDHGISDKSYSNLINKLIPATILDTNKKVENTDELLLKITDEKDSDLLLKAIENKQVNLNNEMTLPLQSLEIPSNPEQESRESGWHKEFTVVPVDERKLMQVDNKPTDDNVFRTQSSTDLCALNKDQLNTNTEVTSHSNEVFNQDTIGPLDNNQDTIGPLDNPAFLRTLHYSESQYLSNNLQLLYQEENLKNSTEDLRSLTKFQEIPDLDQGWAWVVLAAAFWASTLLGATVYAAGVLMSAIMEEINPDLTKVAWVGSVNVFVMYLTGPFVGFTVKKYGARLTVSIAGIVVALGFLGASFSHSIGELILTHGVIAGLGAGYSVNPMVVVVGQYFDKYRGLACGLLACGAGIGLLTGGTCVSLLLETYGLSGTYLIWAGLMLNITPAGMLIRPSPEERLRKTEVPNTRGAAVDEVVSSRNSMTSGLNSPFGSRNHSIISGMDKVGYYKKPASRAGLKFTNLDAETPLIKTALQNQMSQSCQSFATNRQLPLISVTSLFQQGRYVVKSSNSEMHPLPFSPSETQATQGPLSSQNAIPNHFNCRRVSATTLATSTYMPNTLHASPTSMRVPHQRASCNFPSTSRTVSLRGSLHPDNDSISSALISKLRPRDGLAPRHPLGSRSISTFMGSIASFPTALAMVTDDVSRYETCSISGSNTVTVKSYLTRLIECFHILQNRQFLAFIGTCFVWAFGESPVIVYLPSYAISRGTNPMQASSLYTAMGTGSIMGRFLSGLLASNNEVAPLLLHIGCLGITGVIVVVSPLITSTYPGQMVFSWLLGLYTRSMVPLTSLVIIEMLGIKELGQGFGFLSMTQGLGYLIGPPLASMIVCAIGYQNCYVFSGCVLLLASFFTLSIIVLMHSNEEDKYMDLQSVHEMDNDFHKLTNSTVDEMANGLGDRPICGEPCKPDCAVINPVFPLQGDHAMEHKQGLQDENTPETKKNLEEEKLGTILEVV
ncbi:uncharacterized protein LOC131938104 [Physella acuta]|uniref:uncharacterized protein LOC131938104 n=1 Tax=Physella acuta TaxID=109671 RepID=UPI0027DB0BAF|nr:uncharacterized protein LOC131938104 [Physella acuta]